MVTRKPYRIRLYRPSSHTVLCVATLVVVGLLSSAYHDWKHGESASLTPSHSGNALSVSIGNLFGHQPLIPNVLEEKDIALYQTIFRAQKREDWETADLSIQHLNNKVLLGHVLADRYLNHHYTTKGPELADWLSHYSDQPQAADIYSMTVSKAPGLRGALAPVKRPQVLIGYGDDNGLAVRPEDEKYSRMWRAGIEAWKNNHKGEAAKMFSSLVKHSDELSPWTKSAAAYWSWRSYNAIGERKLAESYLRIAAEEPRSFYGILACRQLRVSLDLDTTPVALTDTDILEMVGDQSIRRIVALSQIGQNELADRELRVLFPQAEDGEKMRLLALANQLGLASVQISMAKQLDHDGRSLDFAKYPIPKWKPDGGFKVNPALIYAVARQESGFRASAVSPGGALGLMQLMPKTALLMQKNMDILAENEIPHVSTVTEPVYNVTLGQNYVQHLLDNDLVEGNLFYMLAAYNAGPGRLQDWKKGIASSNDPLLFVESIPYAQTRHYVMQVMTNYWIYSEIAGTPSESINVVLHNRWPGLDESGKPALADNTADGRAG